jgi:hypothetical protein
MPAADRQHAGRKGRGRGGEAAYHGESRLGETHDARKNTIVAAQTAERVGSRSLSRLREKVYFNESCDRSSGYEDMVHRACLAWILLAEDVRMRGYRPYYVRTATTHVCVPSQRNTCTVVSTSNQLTHFPCSLPPW